MKENEPLEQEGKNNPTEFSPNTVDSEEENEGNSEGNGEGNDTKESKNESEEYAQGVECKVCGEPVKAYETKSGTRYRCDNCQRFVKAVPEGQGGVGKEPEETEEKDTKSSQDVEATPTEKNQEQTKENVYKTETDPNKVLREILNEHPDVDDPQANEVMSWAQYQGQLHPTQVAQILTNLNNISKQTANIVAQKYSLALQNKTQQSSQNVPNMMGTMGVSMPKQQQGNQPPIAGIMGLNQQQNSQMNTPMSDMSGQAAPQSNQVTHNQTQPNSSNGRLTKGEVQEVVADVIKEKEEKSRIEIVEDTQKKLANAVNEMRKMAEKSQIGNGGNPQMVATPQGQEKEDELTKTMKEALAEDIKERIRGSNENEQPQVTEEGIARAVTQGVNSIMDNQNTGDLNQYDAEVQSTQAEVEGEKTRAELEHKARMEEAKQHRKGIESVGQSIEQAMENLGMGAGRAIAQGAGGQTQQKQQGGGTDGGIQPEPITDEDGNPTGEFKFDCRKCGEEIRFGTGENSVNCPDCGELYNLAPTK